MDVRNKKLPPGMSQLDYLWQTFGGRIITEDLSEDIPGALVSAEALKSYLKDNGVNKFELEEEDGNTIALKGLSTSGKELTIVRWDKADNLVAAQGYRSTQWEVDEGIVDDIDIPLLVFTLKSGKKFYISLDQFIYRGIETKTIKTIVTDNKIEAHLKIDDSVEVPVLDIKKTANGLKMDLKIASQDNNQVRLVRTTDGLNTEMTWDNGNDIRFDILPYERYSVITPIPGKVYFIPDANCIYLDGKRYGNNLDLHTTDTIEVSKEGNVFSLEVKVDPDEDNLMYKTEAGLAAKLFWE